MSRPDRVLYKTRPFPQDHIFDPLRHFEPDGIHKRIRETESGKKKPSAATLIEIDIFFNKVCDLLGHVNSFSWLYHVWMKRFYESGALTQNDMTMTAILLRMYSQIDTGKIYNSKKDVQDPSVIATRTDDNKSGYTGFSLDDFNCVNRDRTTAIKKRFGIVFKSWKYKTFENVFLSPISNICETLYQSKFASIFQMILLCLYLS
jgi:hypothetical protein